MSFLTYLFYFILSVRDGFEVDLQWTATVEDSNILPAIFCGQPAFCNWYKHKHRDRPHTQKTNTHTWHACVHTTSTDLTQLNIDYNRRIQFWKYFLLFERGITELRNSNPCTRKLRTNQYPGNNPVKLICLTFAEQQALCNASDMIK